SGEAQHHRDSWSNRGGCGHLYTLCSLHSERYITSPHLGAQLIDTTHATMDLAVQCIEYLCQRHHDPQIPDNECSHKVCTGQYSLHAFSTRMWFDLVCQYFRLTQGMDPPRTLVNSIAMLCESRKALSFSTTFTDDNRRENDDGGDDRNGHGDGQRSEDESESEVDFRILKSNEPRLYEMLRNVTNFRTSSFIFTDPHKDKPDPLSISQMSRHIRQAFNNTLCISPISLTTLGQPACHEQCEIILEYYGPRPFKCQFPQCEFWQHGFATRTVRDRHERSHDKPLKCDVPGCEFGLIGFLSERMRQDHIKAAHQSDSLELSFEIRTLPDDGVDAVLSDLVQGNQVAIVEKILSNFPNALQTHGTRRKLQLLAAFHASDAILKMLEDPDESHTMVRLISDHLNGCIEQSISAGNESTLRYFLSRVENVPGLYGWGAIGWQQRVSYLCNLMSKDWNEGAKAFAKWFREGYNLCDKDNKPRGITTIKTTLNDRKILSAAASHPTGNQQLLCLWIDFNVSIFGKVWASTTLKNVADVGFSIPLASYLLGKGAEINYRPSMKARTALHYAATSTSVEAAEMVRFLLLNGADPEADKEGTDSTSIRGRRKIKKICDEKGAKGIHRWLGITWDELVEETKRVRSNRQVEKQMISEMREQN
ncbi:hypothetical protein F4679DRAFT_594626, partial [Xylaria curta]